MQSISPLVVISLFLPRAYLAFTEALTLQPQVFFPMDNFLLLRISMINESLEEIKPSNRKYPYVDFKPDREPGKEILQVKNITKTYEVLKVLDNVSFTVKQDDKIAFLADNEIAKTVLFQIISGEMEPDSGELVWGTTITKSYF